MPIPEEIKSPITQEAPTNRGRWKPENVQWLKDNYNHCTITQLSEHLNCSKNAVKMMRKRLGLKIDPKSDIRKELMKGNRTKSSSEILSEFRDVFGDKYDYSKMEYKGHYKEIIIGCPIHGEFTRTPMMHKRGYGCPKCRKEDNTIYGVGVSDIPNIKSCRSYQTWIAMLERCYGNMDRYNSAYKDCSVCEEWHLFSNFNQWFEEPENGYHDGYALDKDILVKGNRVYSPQNCCFVPPSLNSMMSRGSHKQREYPIGVIKCKSGRYRASYQQKSLGMFDTPEEAFCAYKAEKETNIKKIAASLFEKGEITHKVYDALIRYEVEITD